ncbi:hypothetical protein SLA2020_060790 [Shorea laevis]
MQPKGGSFKKGDKPSATFRSANPRYDLLTEGTFAVVEMLQGEWWIMLLSMAWQHFEWEVSEEACSGVYSFRHFASSKKRRDSPNKYLTGASSAFTAS